MNYFTKRSIFIKKIIKAMALICFINCITTAPLLWARSAYLTTAASSTPQTVLALQIIEPAIVLNKPMVSSAKLAAFDKKNGRVELTITTEASKLLYKTGRLKKNQKLIFTINNTISEAVAIQKEINKNNFVLSISTSRRNADLIMKFFS